VAMRAVLHAAVRAKGLTVTGNPAATPNRGVRDAMSFPELASTSAASHRRLSEDLIRIALGAAAFASGLALSAAPAAAAGFWVYRHAACGRRCPFRSRLGHHRVWRQRRQRRRYGAGRQLLLRAVQPGHPGRIAEHRRRVLGERRPARRSGAAIRGAHLITRKASPDLKLGFWSAPILPARCSTRTTGRGATTAPRLSS
jgi:hypothetical protein